MCEVTESVAMEMCDVGLAHLECLDFTFTPVTPKALLYFVSKYQITVGYFGRSNNVIVHLHIISRLLRLIKLLHS